MLFAILGPLQVRRDGRVLALGGGKPRAVLAVLLLSANEPVSTDRLAAALWGADAPTDAVRTVQVHVSRLRKALGDGELVTRTAAGYRLRVRPGELDAERFEHLLEEGRRAAEDGRHDDARALARAALGLWRGPALADLAFEPFAQPEIARLEELRVATVELGVAADLAAGRHAELVPELQRLVSDHPLRERLHAQLMLSLYRCGRQAEALAAFRRAREVLVEDLGVEPGSELRALEHAILAQDPGLLPGEGAANAPPAPREPVSATSQDTPAVRLPLPPTPTIGREKDLATLAAQAREGAAGARLITVVGPAGVGKTRVAIELGRQLAPAFAEGAVFVSLAPLHSAGDVPSTIARELGVVPGPGESPEAALARRLGRRRLLLVLDNFEHVLDAAPLVADLLAGAAGLTVLATSREPLDLRAERVFRLGPLATGPETGPGSEPRKRPPALVLFEAAARARDARFELRDDDVPAAIDLCRLLDGLPLAIELAAARISLMPVEELAARLRSGLDPLGAAPRDAPDRQRTLTATLQWSFALLDGPAQSALVELATFAGGCTPDAARAVTRAPQPLLESLVAKSLVLAAPGEDGVPRLGMLETVRAFARSRLEQRPDADDVRRRHCEHYVAMAERYRPELERSSTPARLAELDRELDNMRTAFAWAIERAPELALRLAAALARYWALRSIERERRSWLAAALERAGTAAPPDTRAEALSQYALSLTRQDTRKEAKEAALESLRIRRALGDDAGCARSVSTLATLQLQVNDVEAAYRSAREAERLAHAAGDEQARTWSLGTMAMTAPTVPEALALGRETAARYRAAGNRRDLAGLQTSLVYTTLFHGDHETAARLSVEALEAAEAYGDPFVLALAKGNAGLAALFTGAATTARDAFTGELRLTKREGREGPWEGLLFEALTGLAAVAAQEGQDRLAAMLGAAADGATSERHDPRIAEELSGRFFAPSRARLGEHAWLRAREAGAALDQDEAIDAALSGSALRAVA